MDFFSKQNLRVSMIAAGGDLSICACDNGGAYAWPFNKGGVN